MSSVICEFGNAAFLAGAKAMVVISDSTGFLDDTRDQKVSITPVNKKGKEVDFVPWGATNKLPVEILKKIIDNITVASNIDFNARISYGDGIMVVRKEKDADGKIKFLELIDSDAPEIFKFLKDNNFERIFQEAGNDLVTFSDSYIELLLDRNVKPKIVMVRHKEAAFSRLSVQNEKTGEIDYHGYSSKWGNGDVDDVVITPFLDRDAPMYDLKKRLGLYPDEKTGKYKKVPDSRFVLSLGLPAPGRFYYNVPYWWSIFKSKWYDFSCSIPLFKQALIENEMVLKYEISINETFFDKLYNSEKISDEAKKAARRTAFLKQLDDFLAGKENAGKSFVKTFKYDMVKGFEVHDIIIKPIPSFLKGGEYIEDAEEASNMICYAMGVHPSLQGASPGKGKSINGTEARELFIIKQALSKPLRQSLLQVLYIVKEINGWSEDIHFVVPNIMLTTLDNNTGAEKSIGNQKI